MPITFPFPVRVSVGLVLTGVEHLRTLPSDLPTLGVSAAGQAMRWSMRIQQEFATLAVRGDEVLSRIGGDPPEHPAWATFDEEESDPDGQVVAVIDDDAADGELILDAGDLDDDPESDGYAGEQIQELAEVIALDLVASARSGVAATTDDDRTGDDGAEASHVLPEADEASPRADEANPRADETSPLADEPRPETDGAAHQGGPGPAAESEVAESGPTESTAAEEVDYDSLTLAQLRGTLRRLSADDVTGLLDRERTGADRPAFVTLLTNRLTSLEQGHP